MYGPEAPLSRFASQRPAVPHSAIIEKYESIFKFQALGDGGATPPLSAKQRLERRVKGVEPALACHQRLMLPLVRLEASGQRPRPADRCLGVGRRQ